MLTRYKILSVGLLLCIASLVANEPPSERDKTTAKADLYAGGFVTGFSMTTLGAIGFFPGNAAALFQIGYYGPHWMFDIGTSYWRQKVEYDLAGIVHAKVNHNYYLLLTHFGKRKRVYDNLFISFGAMLLHNWVNGWWVFPDSTAAGVFTGFDYQLSKHFLLSGKIYPYTYDHRYFSRSFHEVFAHATLSLFYVF